MAAWVAVSGVGQEPPMDHFFMDYERHGDEWRRTYPADTRAVNQRRGLTERVAMIDALSQ
jgi:hypothetical protein